MKDNAIRQFVRRELRAVTMGVAATAIGMGGGLPSAMASGLTGGSVVSGQGSITNPNATTTLINQQSSSLTLNWSTFNVAGNETVKFVQPSSTSVALNNILSANPSQIFGRIDANGRVVLINPNGILFGRTAQLNVGSLIASSLELKEYDPTTGHLSFQSLSGHPGVIDNEGTITAGRGGSVALLGGTVLNNGLVLADYGTVAMGAGEVATLDFYGGGLLRMQVSGDLKTNSSGAAAAVQNNGRIEANGGQVVLTAAATQDVFASAVNNTGVVRANRIENVGGVIELTGPDGVVANNGTLDASGVGANSTGGKVTVSGNDVGLFGASTINASGPAGGGTVLVGGGFHGANPDVADASHTYVGADATIDADATQEGNGGNVAVWSNDGTRYYGGISARGAGQGAGGYTEVSGKGYLDYQGQVDLQAPTGKTGTLLLDPTQITIEDGADGTDTAITTTGTGPFTDTSSGAGSILMDGTINTQLGTANVTVTTSAGDIVISNAAGPVVIGPATANTNTLTLNSFANISWNAGWSYTNNGQLSLYAAGGSISANATGEAIALGGTSPLLMQASTGIGSASIPIETTGLTSVAANNGTGGIYISNSGTGDVTVSSLTNPVTATAVAGLSVSGSDISLVNTAGSIAVAQAIDAGSAAVTLTAGTTISESGSGKVSATAGLTTSSVGGTTLGGANAVGDFNATNTTTGNVSLTNAGTLTLSGINQSGGGSVSVNNAGGAGGTTLTGAVGAGTGSVTLKDTSGTLALGAHNVTGAGVTLQGAGVTQSAGSTVNAGSGDISVDGGAGAVNMAGALTTTSNSATAATVLNATTVALPAITTGATGTTTIGAGDISGAVTQSGATTISTGTLTGSTHGSVTLGNANSIPTIGAFTSTGFTLDDGQLNITGSLAGGSGGVDLVSTGAISESGSGLISGLGGLTTSSVGGTTLGGANAVGSFNATNTTSGNVTLTNAATLTISGISQAGGGSVSVNNAGGTTLTGAVTAGAGSVTLKDTTGSLALGTHNVSGGGVTLQGKGVTQSAASTVNAGSGDISVNGGGGAVAMAGALTTTSNTVTAVTVQNATTVGLPAITTGATGTTTIGAGDISGAVTQGSTTISTGTLIGNTSGSVLLANANTVPTVGAFTSNGFIFNDADPLSVAGALADGAGNVTLSSSGTIAESGAGLISTSGTLKTTSVGGTTLGGSNVVSTFDATNSGSGAVSLTNGAATTLTVTGLSQTGGGLVSVMNTGSVTFANTNSADGGLSVTSSNGGVTLGSSGADSLTVTGGALSVTSDGSITEQTGSSVSAPSTQLTLNSPTGDLILKNAAAMGTLSLTGTGHNLDLESTTQGQINTLLTGDTWAAVTVVNSGAAISLPNFNATAGLDVTAPGISQSAGPIVVTGVTTLSSAGNPISLNNSGNSFSGNVAFTGSSVTLVSGGALSSSGAATGTLSETAGGTISEGGAITVTAGNTATFTVNGATGDVNLSNSSNDFHGDPTAIQASGGGTVGNVSVTDTDTTFVPLTLPATVASLTLNDTHAAITLPAAAVGGALIVTAGGAITQTGALSVQGSSTLNAGTNAVTLTNGSNSFAGNVNFTGSAVTLASGGALSSSGTATGSLSETAGGTISEGGAITVAAGNTATFAINGATGDVNLGNSANDFHGDATTIQAIGGGTVGNVTVADTNATFAPLTLPATLASLTLSDPNAPIAVAAETLTGALDVTAGGPITQTGALLVSGASALNAGGADITLSNAGNALTGGISVTGRNVTVVNTAGTTIAGTSTASNLTLDAGGSVTFGSAGSDSTSVANGLVVQGLSGSGAAGGTVSQVGTLSVGTTASIDAGGNAITLANASNALGGPITLTGGAVTLANSEGTTLAGANSAGSLTLDAGGAVIFGTAGTDTTTVTNGLIVQGLSGSGATGGAVSEAGSMSVGGSTAIDAGARGIALSNTANAFAGPLTLIGGAVTLANADATTFAGASNMANLTLEAGGAVNETGTLSVSGTSTLQATGNAITLGNSGNSFGGSVAFTGADVTLASNGALSSSGTATGSLTETAAGAITQTGVLNVTGTSTLNANGSDITLTQANTFGGNVAFSGRNVTLTAGTGGLSTSGTASGTLTEVAPGAITQVGALSVTGNTTLTANGAGNITLANSANAFAGLVTLKGGAVTLANADATTLAGTDNASSLTLNAGGGVTFGNASTDSTTVANNLVVQGVSGSGAAGGAVSEVGTLSVGGTTSINTGGHDITLLQANAFTGAVSFAGQNVSLSTSSGSLTSSGTAGGNLVERAEGSAANLNVGSLSAGGEVLLIAGSNILGTSNQATVTANNVTVRYGLENPNAQIGGTDPNQQVGFLSASGSQVHLTIWLPAPGTQFQNGDLRQTPSDLLITRDPFGQGEQSLLYSTNLGLTPAQVAGTLGSIQSTLQGSSSQSAGVAQGAATQGTGSVLYIDWASYNPNVSLFGTLNPAVCLPADQRDESMGSGSGCAAASASLLRTPVPIQVAMVPTREGWRAMPLFYLEQ
jgi:filamentous hemagglutinin family protein